MRFSAYGTHRRSRWRESRLKPSRVIYLFFSFPYRKSDRPLPSPLLYYIAHFTIVLSVFTLDRGFTPPTSLAADFHGGVSTWAALSQLARKSSSRRKGRFFSSKVFFSRKRRKYDPLLEHVLSARCYRRFLLFHWR